MLCSARNTEPTNSTSVSARQANEKPKLTVYSLLYVNKSFDGKARKKSTKTNKKKNTDLLNSKSVPCESQIL